MGGKSGRRIASVLWAVCVCAGGLTAVETGEKGEGGEKRRIGWADKAEFSYYDHRITDRFAGLRFSWDYFHGLDGSATHGNETVIDESLRKSSDWRVDMTNSITVSINQHLALKVSLQWLYDNEPALTELPLFATEEPEGDPIGNVAVPLDELDTIFRASMVVNI